MISCDLFVTIAAIIHSTSFACHIQRNNRKLHRPRELRASISGIGGPARFTKTGIGVVLAISWSKLNPRKSSARLA
jgi:hypothetical protein